MRTEPEKGLEIVEARRFARAKIGFQLAAEPRLVREFWDQIGAPANPDNPNLTVLYCSVRRLGETYALLEFVAGETLEELVKRSDPASCEQEIPVFCRLLDAFEGGTSNGNVPAAGPADIELIDFGVARASAPAASRLHGAVLAAPGGACSEQIFGELGASREQVCALLMELCARLPGQLPRSSAYGPANLGECAVRSLATQVLPSEPIPPTAAPPVKRSLLVRTVTSPYVIALATALLVLVVLYGVGEFLAKRGVSDNAGKLLLPPFSPVVEVPLEITPEIQPAPDPVSAIAVRRAAKKRPDPQPVASIIIARGARPIRQTSLEYPAEAKKEHISGVVEMQVTIAEDGTVRSPQVLSGDPLLRAGLTDEISKWVYQPLRVNGKPVPMTTELAIKFNLNP